MKTREAVAAAVRAYAVSVEDLRWVASAKMKWALSASGHGR